ncbi:hypothetical protein GCM10020366_18080 [Saccharopolyspora gregorii]|uniref:Uncharacterized protein n=1 Tax=Saccharopolyspora gregorii TaxID=33914 RepID=A0ABP6RKS2_9PSEU
MVALFEMQKGAVLQHGALFRFRRPKGDTRIRLGTRAAPDSSRPEEHIHGGTIEPVTEALPNLTRREQPLSTGDAGASS